MRPVVLCSLLAFTGLLTAVTWSVPHAAYAQLSCSDCGETAGNCQCVINGAGAIVCNTGAVDPEDDEIRGVTLSDGTYPVIWGWIDQDGSNDYFCCDYTNDLDSTAHNLVVRTYDGDDFVYLNQGCLYNSTYHFWEESALVEAGAGNDRVEGGAGPDTIMVGAGWDVAFGYQDADTIMAPANDTGTNELWGGELDDDIYGGAAADFCYGGEGVDTVRGGAGADYVCGADPLLGDDYVVDIVQGNEDTDTCAEAGDTRTTCDSYHDTCDP
jgi:Ca2+-binding RTX toxin-like protein